MNIKELKDKLESLPEDLEIICNINNHSGRLELVQIRDFLNDEKQFKCKKLLIGNTSYCTGWPELTEKLYQTKSKEFLDALGDENKPRKELRGNGRRFTTIHGDYRIYTDYGGRQDSCFGIAYDPRIIQRMIDEGLIVKIKSEHYGHCNIGLTNKRR